MSAVGRRLRQIVGCLDRCTTEHHDDSPATGAGCSSSRGAPAAPLQQGGSDYNGDYACCPAGLSADELARFGRDGWLH